MCVVQILPRAMPLAIASCDQDDGMILPREGGDSEEEEEEDGELFRTEAGGGRPHGLSVRTAVLDEKAAATQAIGMFAKYCSRPAFLPFLPAAWAVLKRHSGYFHADVRMQACIAMKSERGVGV